MTTMPVDKGFIVTSGFGPRWGTVHYGTDFGRTGGSGGYPIYAVKSGTVTAAGPASGFGRWINVDHPASNGGGLTVYGHIIPEVSVGQSVREGQRIGRINPNSATNGGVAPHLHFEWHRYVWSAPGPDRLNPMTMLAGAKWPGDASAPAPAPAPANETSYILDISSWQNPISLRRAKEDGISGVILRTNDGTYRDQVFHSHLADAKAAGLPVSAYWFVRRPNEGTTIAQQADVVASQLAGHGDIGIWLDVESPGGMDRSTVYAARDAMKARGIRVIGIYSTAGYWENIRGGEPPASDFGAIWVAHFGQNRAGAYRDIYPGNSNSVWNYPLGNRKPDLWQYTERGRIPSFNGNLDVNAFRGTPAQVKALFEGKSTTTPGGITVSEADRIIRHMTDFVKGYVGPIGQDVKDIRAQLTGGRNTIIKDGKIDVAASYPGWKQLGQNEKGNYLTVTDALAALRQQLADIEKAIDDIAGDSK